MARSVNWNELVFCVALLLYIGRERRGRRIIETTDLDMDLADENHVS